MKEKKIKKEKRQFVILCWVFAALACERCEQISSQPGYAKYLSLMFLWMTLNHIKKKSWKERESISFGRDLLSPERNIILSGCFEAIS